jgi:hypothetical protein
MYPLARPAPIPLSESVCHRFLIRVWYPVAGTLSKAPVGGGIATAAVGVAERRSDALIQSTTDIYSKFPSL